MTGLYICCTGFVLVSFKYGPGDFPDIFILIAGSGFEIGQAFFSPDCGKGESLHPSSLSSQDL